MRTQRLARRFSGLATIAALLATGCGDTPTDRPASAPAGDDPGAVHVHGLGVDPADGALFLATHTGLFRAEAGQPRARRVADRFQDTMGFTVVGPSRFLGSGHPDGREDLPPFLGLIESRDAGESWHPVSLLGEVDFHVLEASGGRIYGYGSDFQSREPTFLTSADRGKTWKRLQAPEPLISLAISPSAPGEIVASGELRVYRSSDAGRRWRPVDAPGPGLLAWNDRGLFLIDGQGQVWRAGSAAGPWTPTPGAVGGQPAAVDSGPSGELLVALHDGTVKQSADAGRTWTIRIRPS